MGSLSSAKNFYLNVDFKSFEIVSTHIKTQSSIVGLRLTVNSGTSQLLYSSIISSPPATDRLGKVSLKLVKQADMVFIKAHLPQCWKHC